MRHSFGQVVRFDGDFWLNPTMRPGEVAFRGHSSRPIRGRSRDCVRLSGVGWSGRRTDDSCS